MGYRVSGILKLPDGTPANNAEIEFVSRKNFSPLVQELKSNIRCSVTGAYDVTLEYGEYAVIVYPGGTYPAALGTIIIAVDTVAGQDLPALLQQGGWQPATPEYVQQIQAWLSEAGGLASSAGASAAAAKASEAAALSSKNAAAASAATATTKASEATTAASTAATKATEASDSASSALSSKNTAATSATAASNGASTATAKAGGAAASASAAKTSETNAKTSETNAAASASNAAATLAGAVPNTRKVNGKALSADVVIGAGDIANVVGLVSLGAIIERGSNANGEYIKFADGTMVCCLSNFNIPATALSANFSRVCNLPAVFASINGMKPAASVLSTNSGNLGAAGELYRNGFSLLISSVSQINFAGYTYLSPIQTPLTIGIQVIGRWS